MKPLLGELEWPELAGVGTLAQPRGAKRPSQPLPSLMRGLLPHRSLHEQLALRLPAPHRQHEGPSEQGAR